MRTQPSPAQRADEETGNVTCNLRGFRQPEVWNLRASKPSTWFLNVSTNEWQIQNRWIVVSFFTESFRLSCPSILVFLTLKKLPASETILTDVLRPLSLLAPLDFPGRGEAYFRFPMIPHLLIGTMCFLPIYRFLN